MSTPDKPRIRVAICPSESSLINFKNSNSHHEWIHSFFALENTFSDQLTQGNTIYFFIPKKEL